MVGRHRDRQSQLNCWLSADKSKARRVTSALFTCIDCKGLSYVHEMSVLVYLFLLVYESTYGSRSLLECHSDYESCPLVEGKQTGLTIKGFM